MDKEGKGTDDRCRQVFANLGSVARRRPTSAATRTARRETVPGTSAARSACGATARSRRRRTSAFFDRHQPFSLATWFRIDKAGTAGPLITRSGSFANGYRGYLVRIEADGTLTAALHHVAPDDSIEIRTTDAGGRRRSGGTVAHLRRLEPRAGPAPVPRTAASCATRTIVDNLQRSLINSGIEGRQMSGSPLGLRLGSVGELSKESLRDVTRRRLPRLRAAAQRPRGGGAGHRRATRCGRCSRCRRRSARQPIARALRQHYVLRVDAGIPHRASTR